MRYLKTYEAYNGDEINAIDHFEKIIDLLKYKNIKIDDGNYSRIIGRIQINPTVSSSGELLGFSNTEFKYEDGTDIKLGDSVIVLDEDGDDDFMATVDCFSDGEVIVIDMEENVFYFTPNRIKRNEDED